MIAHTNHVLSFHVCYLTMVHGLLNVFRLLTDELAYLCSSAWRSFWALEIIARLITFCVHWANFVIDDCWAAILTGIVWINCLEQRLCYITSSAKCIKC